MESFKNYFSNVKTEEVDLIFTGANVLERDVLNQSFDQLFPSFDIEEFQAIKHDTNGTERISLIRDSIVSDFITEFNFSQKLIGNIELGSSLKKLHQEVLKQSANQSILTFESRNLSHYELLAYTGCLKNLLGLRCEYLHNVPKIVSEGRSEKESKSMFNKAALVMAVSILLLGFVSTISKHFFIQSIEENEAVLSFTLQERKEISELKDKLRRIDEAFSAVHLNDTPFLSEQAFKISQSVPNKIRLYSLILSPEESSNRSEELKIEKQFQSELILIQGSHSDMSSLNQFIEHLSQLEFISEVNLESVDRDRNNRGEFKLSVVIAT